MRYHGRVFDFLKQLWNGTGAKRESLGRMVNHSTVLLMVSIGVIILILAFLILFHENANATNGYRLRSLERERSVLMLEQEVLNMQVAQFQALQNLNADPQVSGMIQPKTVRYVRTADILRASSSSSFSSTIKTGTGVTASGVVSSTASPR